MSKELKTYYILIFRIVLRLEILFFILFILKWLVQDKYMAGYLSESDVETRKYRGSMLSMLKEMTEREKLVIFTYISILAIYKYRYFRL
jgi:hypothetical protein